MEVNVLDIHFIDSLAHLRPVMALIPILLALITLFWMGRSAYSFLIHYRQAQRLGVPILVSPVGHSNVLWLLVQDVIADYIALLPFGLGGWVRYNRRSWHWMFKDRGRIHQQYGPIIAHVNPDEIHIWISDKDVVNEILKGKDRALFDKPREDIEVVDFLGPHLMTACGDTWKRHRRIVATPFTQRNNRIVWAESLHQGLIVGEHWLKSSSDGFRSMWKDNETMAMNVMVSAGFGLSRESHEDFVDDGRESFGFHSSLSYMLHHFIWIILIPSSFWFPKTLPPFPRALRSFLKSVRAFKEHLDRMVSDSKTITNHTMDGTIEPGGNANTLRSDNLLTALVRHSEEVKQGKHVGSALGMSYKDSLTDDEIVSNLFGLAFAGHETVAHTLAYSLFLLAAHPHIQKWVAEEIRQVLNGRTDIESLDLDETFPLLVRTKAVMFETLRVFTPLPNIFKRSLSHVGDIIHVGSRSIRIPPRAYVLPSLYALHVLEEYWGKDSLEWKPQRWVSINDQGREEFLQPSPSGTFLPWSDGPRSCPGARFAQVEFVAVCAALLAKFRISVVCQQGEDEDTAIGRVKTALHDSTAVITLMVKDPEKLPLKLDRRETPA